MNAGIIYPSLIGEKFPGYKQVVGEQKPGHKVRTISVYPSLKEVVVEYWYWPPFDLFKTLKSAGIQYRVTFIDTYRWN